VAPPGRAVVLHGQLAECTGVDPILSYGGPFGVPSSRKRWARQGLAMEGLLLLSSLLMGGLSSGWFVMGCVPMVPPSSCGARQGFGWGGKGGGVVRRRWE
jgi:hypothetical protein